MGAFLDKPATDKETHGGSGHGLSYGLASMQGWRMEMEDAHIARHDLEPLPEHAFFAVFDGHGGKTVSTQSGLEFVDVMLKQDVFTSGDKSAEHLSKTLKQAHFAMDDYLEEKFPDLKTGGDRSGATAVTAFVTPTHVVIGNCGDSRAVLCNKGKVRFATEDHKPTNPGEKKRIEKANGHVAMGRVNGNLAVSRALGDFVYKDIDSKKASEQKVSPEPDMKVLKRMDKDEFLVLACDGIWDVMSNDEVCQFVTNQLKAGYTPVEISCRLLDYCLSRDSRDNMSAVVVTFPGAPEKVEGFEAPEVIPDPDQAPNARESDPQRLDQGPGMDLQALMSLMRAAQVGNTGEEEQSQSGAGDDGDDDDGDGTQESSDDKEDDTADTRGEEDDEAREPAMDEGKDGEADTDAGNESKPSKDSSESTESTESDGVNEGDE